MTDSLQDSAVVSEVVSLYSAVAASLSLRGGDSSAASPVPLGNLAMIAFDAAAWRDLTKVVHRDTHRLHLLISCA
jgi:hypothetical protein